LFGFRLEQISMTAPDALNMKFASKVVKNDSKIIISLCETMFLFMLRKGELNEQWVKVCS